MRLLVLKLDDLVFKMSATQQAFDFELLRRGATGKEIGRTDDSLSWAI